MGRDKTAAIMDEADRVAAVLLDNYRRDNPQGEPDTMESYERTTESDAATIANLEAARDQLASEDAERKAEIANLEAEYATKSAAVIAEAKIVCGEASYQHRIAVDRAQPYLEAAQRAAQVLDAAQVRLHQLLEAAKGEQ
jgi:hypothetical protein